MKTVKLSIAELDWRAALAAIAFTLLSMPMPVQACSVPVFRYALERWRADLYEIDVFYRGALSEAEHRHLDRFEEDAAMNGGTANFETVRIDLDGRPEADLIELWQSTNEPTLPWAVVRLPLPGGQRAVVWQGKLTQLSRDLFDSPARREISRRLLSGDSVVWLVVGDPVSKPVKRALATLEAQLPVLSEETPLPPGVGQPGSELLARVPLEVRFSSLAIDISNLQEIWLHRILRSQAPRNLAHDEPLAVAIFGRGRVFEVFRAGDLDADYLADVSRFLCGACSCQVKQLTPGFDLVTATPWDEQLFGTDTPPAPAPEASTELTSVGLPLEVTIPPGLPESSVKLADRKTTALVPGASDPPAESEEDLTDIPPLIGPLLGAAVCIMAAGIFVLRWRRHR